MARPTKLTRDEFETIINNYKAQGKDVTELKKTLAEAYPAPVSGTKTWNDIDIKQQWKQQTVEELKQQALITKGKCRICGKEGKLYSETCEECFVSWAFAIIDK